MIDLIERRRRRIVFAGVGALLFVLVVLFVFGPGWYQGIKEWRARGYTEEARELIDAQEYERAMERARLAYNLAPEQLETVRLVAELNTLGGSATAQALWAQAVELSGGASDDRRGLARAALRAGDLETAREQVEEVLRTEPGTPGNELLLARLLMAEGSTDKALAAAAEAVKDADAGREAHLFYVALALMNGGEAQREAALAHLRGLAERADELGLTALQNLARQERLDARQASELADLLRKHPAASRGERLLALELERRAGILSDAETVAAARELYDIEAGSERAELGVWLRRQGMPEETIALIPGELARTRQDLFLVRLDALAELGRWQEIHEALQGANVPLDRFHAALFRARALWALGDQARARLAWERALLDAGPSTERLNALFRQSRRFEDAFFMRKVLRRMVEVPALRRQAYLEWLQLEQNTGDTSALLNVLREMEPAFPDEPAVRNDIAYLHLLRGGEIDRWTEEARTLLEAEPQVLAYRMTYALGLLRQGQTAQALEQIENLSINWRDVPDKWRVVAAAILRANDRRALANEFLASVDQTVLLPEEKELAQEYIERAP